MCQVAASAREGEQWELHQKLTAELLLYFHSFLKHVPVGATRWRYRPSALEKLLGAGLC